MKRIVLKSGRLRVQVEGDEVTVSVVYRDSVHPTPVLSREEAGELAGLLVQALEATQASGESRH